MSRQEQATQEKEIKQKAATTRFFWRTVLGYEYRADRIGAEMLSYLERMIVGLIPHLGKELPDTTHISSKHAGKMAMKISTLPDEEGYRFTAQADILYLTEDGDWVTHDLRTDYWSECPRWMVETSCCLTMMAGLECGLSEGIKRRWGKKIPTTREDLQRFTQQHILLHQIRQARMITEALPIRIC